MARRKNGVAEVLLEMTAALPWWMGVSFAVIAYTVLNDYASIEMPASAAVPGQIGHMLVEQMGGTLAYYGQYILPFLFLVGALASVLKRHKRKGLVKTVSNGKSRNALHDMTWRDFELLVGEIFRMRGFSVIETGGGGADGGIDLILKKEGEIFLVQCKQWRAYKVSVNVVRELFGVMISKGAAGGFVVTSGVFTAEAKSFAKEQNIELLDGADLMNMVGKAREDVPVSFSPKQKTSAILSSVAVPSCPRCGDAMVKRMAKKGANSGNMFWGCAGFPKCRGVRAAV